jgi:hypothetical protein
MQPGEIEKQLESLMNEQIDILKQEDGFLKPILKSGSGIKDKQLSEFAVNGGFKPDLSGNTVPVPINTNFITGGLKSVTYYYIDHIGGRKSLIMNSTVMGKSGHFATIVRLNSTGVMLDKNKFDCGTTKPLELTIKSNQHLRRLRGRYYRLPHQRSYKTIEVTDSHLVGETILLRSPITCAGEKVCHMCYGDLYHTNKDLNSVGAYAGAKITEPLSQAILSSKHLLTTNSQIIKFTGPFEDFFSLYANEVVFNPNDELDMENFSILVIKDNIHEVTEFDEGDFNSYLKLFSIKNKKTGEIFEIHEEGMNDMFVAPELSERLKEYSKGRKRDFIEIPMSQLYAEERLFVLEVENNELTRPLYEIIRLLDTADRKELDTIDKVNQRFLDLMIISKIPADAVHAECIIRPLVRSDKDVLKRPNFKKYAEDYSILTVSDSLYKNPSPLVSLSFQFLKRQLNDPLTFKKREGSFVDPLFKVKPE